MSQWVFEKAVTAPTHAPPTEGRIYRGKNIKPEETDNNFIRYENEIDSENTDPETVESCIEFARKILEQTNKLVLQDKPDPKWTSKTRTRYDQGRIIRKKLMGSEITPLEEAYWTFDSTPGDNAFGAACSVTWGSTGTTDDKDNVSGVVTRLHNGRKTQCLYPRYSNKCYPIKSAKKGALKPNVCTGLNLDDWLGDACRAWYDTLPEEVGVTNQTTISSSICTNLDWDLDECVCLNRNLDPTFTLSKTSTLSAAADECWWLPCKNDDPAVRIVPAMIKGRRGCPVSFCGNNTQIINADQNVITKETSSNVICTTNTGGGSNGSDVVKSGTTSPILNSTQEQDDDLTATDSSGGMSTMTWVFIGITVFVLCLVLFFTIRSVREPVVTVPPVTTS